MSEFHQRVCQISDYTLRSTIQFRRHGLDQWCNLRNLHAISQEGLAKLKKHFDVFKSIQLQWESSELNVMPSDDSYGAEDFFSVVAIWSQRVNSRSAHSWPRKTRRSRNILCRRRRPAAYKSERTRTSEARRHVCGVRLPRRHRQRNRQHRGAVSARHPHLLSEFAVLLEDARPLLLSSTIQDDNTVFSADMSNPDLLVGDQIAVRREDKCILHRLRFLWQGACYAKAAAGAQFQRSRHAGAPGAELRRGFSPIYSRSEASGERRAVRPRPCAATTKAWNCATSAWTACNA